MPNPQGPLQDFQVIGHGAVFEDVADVLAGCPQKPKTEKDKLFRSKMMTLKAWQKPTTTVSSFSARGLIAEKALAKVNLPLMVFLQREDLPLPDTINNCLVGVGDQL